MALMTYRDLEAKLLKKSRCSKCGSLCAETCLPPQHLLDADVIDPLLYCSRCHEEIVTDFEGRKDEWPRIRHFRQYLRNLPRQGRATGPSADMLSWRSMGDIRAYNPYEPTANDWYRGR